MPRSYGSLVLHGQNWHIHAEPHVMIRLRRVFERAEAKHGQMILKDSEEICKDLLWAMERFPLDVEPEQRAILVRRTMEFDKRAEAFIGIMSGKMMPTEFASLALELRQYQRVAADLAIRMKRLLIADDLGIGKTAMAIAAATDPRLRPALIVTQSHLPRQWVNEFKKFAPSLTTHVVKTRKLYPIAVKQPRGKQLSLIEPQFPDVLIISYSKLAAWRDTLAGIMRSVTFDEVQEVRHQGTDKYKAAEHVSHAATYCIGLSATPIYNYGSEFYNVLNVISPDALGTQQEFTREWCGGSVDARGRSKIKDPKAFGSYLRESGIMIRRTRKDVGRELPPLTKIPHYVESDVKALDKVRSSVVDLAKYLLRRQGTTFDRMRVGGELDWKLRQATGLAKAPFVAEFVRMIVEGGEKVLLYGWHHAVYEVWKDRLKDVKVVFFTGDESPAQKEKAKKDFVDGDAQVLIMSLRAGSGLDGLQHACRTVIFGELDWSPGVHEQCLSEDTEVLTRRGFLGPDGVKDDDLVAAWDKDSGSVEWRPIVRIVDRPLGNEAMYALSSPGIDLRVTAGHRMVYRSRKPGGKTEWKFATAEELSGRTQTYDIPAAGIEPSVGLTLSDDEIRLIGWFLTDGSLNRQSRQLVISQASSSPFNEDIVRCLVGCGMHYGIAVTPAGTGSRFDRLSDLLRYYVPKFGPKGGPADRGWAKLEPFLEKDFSPLLEAMDARQFAVLLESVHAGDGQKQNKPGQTWTRRSCHINTGNRLFAERLQSLAIRRGWRSSLHEGRTEMDAPYFTIHLKATSARAVGGTSNRDRPVLTRTPSRPEERVWCVENDLGTLLVRRNGKTAIVGNCIGRVERDGQPDPVVAYFLVSEEGSDPVIADVLGLKKAQIEGVRDPDAELVEPSEAPEHGMRRLAESVLRSQGIDPSTIIPLDETKTDDNLGGSKAEKAGAEAENKSEGE